MKELRLATGVEDEIRAAAGWYEERREGLGKALVLEVQAALLSLRANPERHVPLAGRAGFQFRRARVRRFPYRGVFLETDAELLIVAVAHERRRSSYWESRLDFER